MQKKKILIVFGTRPEAIKMAPVYIELKKSQQFDVKLLITAQHRQLLDGVLNFFKISADYDLDIMKDNQDLFDITANVLIKIKPILAEEKPDIILVHGDTTTSFVASLAAFYLKIPVGHVEAGLRTFNIYSPFPEEMNRTLTTRIAKYYFAPTQTTRNNLLNEGIADENVLVCGNTVIDGLFMAIKLLDKNALKKQLKDQFNFDIENKYILITAHRRENFGDNFKKIFEAISDLAKQYMDYNFIYPVHPNPNVKNMAHEMLGENSNVYLIPPQEYDMFTFLISESEIILTDSGGIQEEAPSLNKPVLVLRDTTERPEALEAGCLKLVGADKKLIISEVSKLLTDKGYYNEMAGKKNPYGDGTTSIQIRNYLEAKL